jgi:glycosyltransferase involved in cell wall biosynthesis
MKKNLIIFNPSLEDGGVEKNLYLLSNYLNKKKINIEVLTCNYDQNYNFDKGIKFIGPKSKFLINKGRKIKYIVCLLILFFNLLTREKKTLVFAFQANIYAVFIAKLLNTKIITRSNSAPTGWSKNYFKNFIYKFLIKSANDVVVNSLEFKKLFFQRFKINVKCIYNPFDKKFINNKIKKKISISFFNKKFLNILVAGRLTDQKDHLTVLKAVENLDENFKLRLIIIGQGYNKAVLKKFIKVTNIGNKVKLIGYKKNPYPYIINSDIVLLSSKYEGLPNILLEAQYLKKYIISTDCPTGPKEILLNGKAGDLVKIGDYKKISYLIKNYKRNKKKINKKINIGFINFKRFDYIKNCEKYLNIIYKNS